VLLRTALARTTLLTVVLLMASPSRAEGPAGLVHKDPSQTPSPHRCCWRRCGGPAAAEPRAAPAGTSASDRLELEEELALYNAENTRVAVRGLRSDAEVLFLLTGTGSTPSFDGRAPMSLPVESLDRIEVIRGSGSTLYGAGALLGVINIITDREKAGASWLRAEASPSTTPRRT
jgi:hypothetical protein